MDEKFGRILDTLEKLGLRKNTLVIFSADHGEEQFEHGFIGHASTQKGGTMYDELIHVPLIISMPGVLPEDQTIETTVRGVDIMPTVFEVLGIPVPTYFHGESLVPILKSPSEAVDRTAFAASSYRGYQEDNPTKVDDLMYAVRSRRWKIVHDVRHGTQNTYRLFDLIADPHETKDVSSERPEVMADRLVRLSSSVA